MHASEIETKDEVREGRQWENGRDGYWLWVTGLGEDGYQEHEEQTVAAYIPTSGFLEYKPKTFPSG